MAGLDPVWLVWFSLVCITFGSNLGWLSWVDLGGLVAVPVLPPSPPDLAYSRSGEG